MIVNNLVLHLFTSNTFFKIQQPNYVISSNLAKQRKKLSPAGEYATRAFARTRQNNRPNRPQPTVTHSQSPVNTSTNHILPTIITTANSSTPIRNHRRRRKRKTTTNRYWRRHNHNIQLDSNAVINLSNATLTHDETQLLAFPFAPLHVKLTGLNFELTFTTLADVCDFLSFFMTTLLRPIPTHFVPKVHGPSHHRDADTFLDAVEHDLFNVTPAPVRDNLTTRERHALKRLRRRNDIVIKSADKGSGTVVMDRNGYVDECLRQLNV